jgi:YD repeat-containing protein
MKAWDRFFRPLVFLIPLAASLFFGGAGGCGQKVQEGALIDSPVQGLSFETATQAGATDADGMFQFVEDETVRFFLGDIEFGEATGQSVVSPFDIVTGAKPLTDSQEIRSALHAIQFRIPDPFEQAANIALTLQTLDADQDPSNGIVLPEGLSGLAAGRTVAFGEVLFFFPSDPGFRGLIKDGRDQSLWPAGPVERSYADAMAALYDALGLNPDISREKTSFQDTDADGTADSRTDRFYNAAGLIEHSETDTNLDGTPDSAFRAFYNDQNRRIRSESDFDGDGVSDNTFFTFYNDLNQVIRTENDTDGDGALNNSTTFEYDALGNLVRRIMDTDANGVTNRIENYTYDENNDRVLEENDNDANGTVDSVVRRFYDSRHNQIRSESDNDNDGVVDAITVSEFNANHGFTRQESDNDADGVPNSVQTLVYDGEGRVIRSEFDFDNDGAPNSISSFEYDDLGNRIRTETDPNGDGVIDRIDTAEIGPSGYPSRFETDSDADGTVDEIRQIEYEAGTWNDFFVEAFD